MDDRIRKWIENIAGLPLQIFPDEGVRVRVSDARTDEPKNRLLALEVVGKNGVLVTGTPRIVKAVKDCAESMTGVELFSPLGLAEIKRLLPPADAESLDEAWGLNYFLSEREKFRPVISRHKVITLKKKDIPVGDEDLRMGERRSSETNDFIWAFACYHNNSNIPAVTVPEYSPNCASVAVVFWKGDDVAGFGVGTEEKLQGQGYGLAVVSAATQFVLEQGGVAWYGAYANNIPSLRIPRRLGYKLVYSSFGA
jgi:RimJ/RimL family protein N-acetyltransferase